jgi:predicted PurR-regulated permease PerM
MSTSNRTNTLVITAIVFAALYVGREVVLPFALAVLFAFLLAPAVKRLERWGVRRIPATLTVVLSGILLASSLGYFVVQQAYDFAYNLPSYEGNILDKASWLQGSGDGAWSRATQAIAEVRQKLLSRNGRAPLYHNTGEAPSKEPLLTSDESKSVHSARGTNTNAPVQVEVVKRLSSEDVVESLISPLISPFATGTTVVIFVIFMLLEREDLRNRVIRVTGGTQLGLTTKALDDATRRVSRYLLMQLATNAIFGFVVAAGLFLIGVPNPILWGTTATFLRFIPMIGPWVAAVMPLALSLALFGGWTQRFLS